MFCYTGNYMKHYWFKPKRFWYYFAAYYPVSWQGWGIVIFFLGLLYCKFVRIDSASHSVSDTLYEFAPWVVGIFLLFDVVTRIKGEYPFWWKK